MSRQHLTEPNNSRPLSFPPCDVASTKGLNHSGTAHNAGSFTRLLGCRKSGEMGIERGSCRRAIGNSLACWGKAYTFSSLKTDIRIAGPRKLPSTADIVAHILKKNQWWCTLCIVLTWFLCVRLWRWGKTYKGIGRTICLSKSSRAIRFVSSQDPFVRVLSAWLLGLQ